MANYRFFSGAHATLLATSPDQPLPIERGGSDGVCVVVAKTGTIHITVAIRTRYGQKNLAKRTNSCQASQDPMLYTRYSVQPITSVYKQYGSCSRYIHILYTHSYLYFRYKTNRHLIAESWLWRLSVRCTYDAMLRSILHATGTASSRQIPQLNQKLCFTMIS